MDQKKNAPADDEQLTTHQQSVTRTALKEGLKYILRHWDCLCQECIEVRAEMLMGVTGIPIESLQSTQDDPIIEECLREFGTEIDLDEFIDGEVRPSSILILYRGHRKEDRPLLVEASPKLAEHLKRARVQ